MADKTDGALPVVAHQYRVYHFDIGWLDWQPATEIDVWSARANKHPDKFQLRALTDQAAATAIIEALKQQLAEVRAASTQHFNQAKLKEVRALLVKDREGLFDSFVERAGPHNGKVTDANALGWLKEYDDAIAALDSLATTAPWVQAEQQGTTDPHPSQAFPAFEPAYEVRLGRGHAAPHGATKREPGRPRPLQLPPDGPPEAAVQGDLPPERSAEFLTWWHDVGRHRIQHSATAAFAAELAFEAGRSGSQAEQQEADHG